MDRLTELAPGITPYRFAFNNPNYWADPTGLFESKDAALAYVNKYDIIGANIIDRGSHWAIESGDFIIYQSGNNIRAQFLNGGTIMNLVIDTAGGGGGSGIGSGFGNSGFGGNGGFDGANGFLGGNTSTDLSYVGNASTIGSFVTNAISSRAAENANYVYKYGTKTASAVELTAQNAKQMGSLAKVTGSISTKIGVAGILVTVGDDWRNDNLGAGTVAKTTIGVLSLVFPGFGLVYGYVDVMTLATTGTSLTTHIGNTVDNVFK